MELYIAMVDGVNIFAVRFSVLNNDKPWSYNVCVRSGTDTSAGYVAGSCSRLPSGHQRSLKGTVHEFLKTS